jgi:PAS domain S-box-containing protein
VIAGLLSTILAWRKDDEVGNRLLAATVFVYTLLAVATYLNTTVDTFQYHSQLVRFVLLTASTSLWLHFTMLYTGYGRWINQWSLRLIYAMPVAIFIGVALPPLRPFVLQPGFDVGIISIFSYLFSQVAKVLVVVLYLRSLVSSGHLYRTQSIALVFAATAPVLSELFLAFNIFGIYDPEPILMIFVGSGLTAALYRFNVLDLVPTGQREAVEEMDDAVLILTTDERIGKANPKARDLLRIADYEGQYIDEILPSWSEVTYDPERGSDWQEVEIERDGETRYLDIEIEPFRDRLDEIVGYLVVMRDITEKKERELDLKRYKKIFQGTEENAYILDEEGRFAMTNPALTEMLGYGPDELIGLPAGEVLEPVATGSQLDFDDDPENAMVADGGPIEVTARTQDDDLIPCETHQNPIDARSDQPNVVGFIRDISDRKQLHRELTQTEGQLETLVDSAPLAIMITTPEGIIEEWNPAAEELFGLTAAETVGRIPWFIPDSEAERIENAHEQVLDGEYVTGLEVELDRADGRTIHASVSAAPQTREHTDSVIGVVTIIEDITAIKEREQQLKTRNEQLEEFAGIVSHDLRNPLTVAQGHVELLKDVDSLDEARDYTEEIEAAHERMEQIIEDLLVLARNGQEVTDLESVHLGAKADEAWDTVDTKAATLENTLGLVVECDPSRLAHLFENCYRNAVEHGGAEVTITVGTLEDEPGFYVMDDGPGIAREERDQIFESGYTTNPDGTGFGLSIVKQVADAHDWSVSVRTGATGGARFEIRT